MIALSVPYCAQFNDYACGAAVLRMVYLFHGISVRQEEIFETRREADPFSGGVKLTAQSLVDDAVSRGFRSRWDRVNHTDAQHSIAQLRTLLETQRTPVIVSQRYTDQHPSLGHFRLVYALGKGGVLLHDPCRRTGGQARRWDIEPFMQRWQPNGTTVMGGVYVVVQR